MSLRLADTHAHLADPALLPLVADVIAAAEAVGVRRILTVGTDPETSARGVELAQRFPMVFAAVGIHPSEAARFAGAAGDAALEEIRRLAEAPKVVAIGEIGLDNHWDRSTAPIQGELFARQIALAAELELPVVVHDREADAEILAALTSVARPAALADRSGVLHCFGGNLDLARAGVQAGFYVSFAGNLTYRRADDLRAAAARVPTTRLLVETDSPYLSPVPRRGQTNAPANVRFVVETLAAVLNQPASRVAEATLENAQRLFGWESR